MLRRLFGRLALGTIEADRPHIHIAFSQDVDSNAWSSTFSLYGSSRAWAARMWFPRGVIKRYKIVVPQAYRFEEERYQLPIALTSSHPLTVALTCGKLSAGTDLVHFEFEAKGRIGGTILPRWVPIGSADPTVATTFASSVERLYRQWLADG